jgi:predicted DNA-binding WGR domain protein
VTIRSGRIGSDGQARTKELASEELARDHVEGLIAEKVARGYRERGGA